MDLLAETEQLNRTIERRQGQIDQIKKQMVNLKRELDAEKKYLVHVEQAQVIVKEAAKRTQEQVAWAIADIATKALQAIFHESYELIVRFENRRGKMECDILLSKHGEEIDPMTASGGGVVDVLSLSLRVAVWAICKDRHPTFLLDEPMTHLARQQHQKAASMFRELVDNMGMQVLMVTHSEDLAAAADVVYEVTQKNGVSFAERVL